MRAKVHTLQLKTVGGQQAEIVVEVAGDGFLVYDLTEQSHPVLCHEPTYKQFMRWFLAHYKRSFIVNKYIDDWRLAAQKWGTA